MDFLNIDKNHYNLNKNNVSGEFDQNNKDNSIYGKKINVKIKDFKYFSDNHFYKQAHSCTNFKMFVKLKTKNNENFDENDINVLEDFIENNSNIDSFTKNFCRFFLKVLYPEIDINTLGNFISMILDDINQFYNLYVKRMYEIYSISSLVCFDRKIKHIDITENMQRTPDNHVSILTQDKRFIVNFILPFE
jgi:hypothetical protein